MKKFCLGLICLTFLIAACSTRQDLSTGLLWKITSTDGKESYLFGTMHLYPPDRIKVSSKVFTLLESCNTLVLERNISDAEDQKLFLRNNKHKDDARAFEVLTSRYGSFRSMERELIRIADSSNIKITGLETAAELLNLQSKVPVQPKEFEQEIILRQFEELLNVYNKQQIAYLADELLDQELGHQARKLLVDKRNQNWLDDIEKLTKYDKAFIAVGMGHLSGEKGLLNLLQQRGYKLERIRL